MELSRRSHSLSCGWEALREEDLHKGNQNHWNSISRSEGADPTFRKSLGRKRFGDWLPTANSHQLSSRCTQTLRQTDVLRRFIHLCLTRVNHFLRPRAAAFAWSKPKSLYHKLFVFVFMSLPVFLLAFSLFFNSWALTPFFVFNTMSSLDFSAVKGKVEPSAKR